MTDNQENLTAADKKKLKKGPRFMRHRAKYQNDIDGFNVADKSPIRNGLVRDRQCTDMFCGIVLVMCALGFFGVAGWSISTGEFENLFRGVDGNLNVCGNGLATGKPLLLLVQWSEFSTETSMYQNAVCVEKCPKSGDTPLCLPTNATTKCSEFAALKINTEQYFTSCVSTAAANDASKAVKAGIDKVKDEARVFEHFAW